MKRTLTLAIILLCHCNTHAQYTSAPQPPRYNIVNTGGATLSQVVDTMYAYANTADTTEGSETDNINVFNELWEDRVLANGSGA